MKKVFVNGTFDILHRGHLEMLQYAREQGDYLLVAIDSDERVKQLKGNDRPINNQADRRFILESLKWVDACQIFRTDEELISIITAYSPDVMVKGGDYAGKPIIGFHQCKEVHFYEHTGHSTTGIIQRIANR